MWARLTRLRLKLWKERWNSSRSKYISCSANPRKRWSINYQTCSCRNHRRRPNRLNSRRSQNLRSTRRVLKNPPTTNSRRASNSTKPRWRRLTKCRSKFKFLRNDLVTLKSNSRAPLRLLGHLKATLSQTTRSNLRGNSKWLNARISMRLITLSRRCRPS